MKPRLHTLLLAALPLLLAACAAIKPAAPKPPETAAQKDLAAGLALYNAGDYAGAIKQLGSADIAKADKATQLEAIKFTAFSYCLTGKAVPCRQQFQKALKLDPAFDLAPGEQGHPMWAPVFDKAKKERR